MLKIYLALAVGVLISTQNAFSMDILARDSRTGQPIKGAEILVAPLPTPRIQVIKTDDEGRAQIDLSQEKSALFNLTVYAENFHIMTLVDIPKAQPLVTVNMMGHIQKVEKAEIKGLVQGFGRTPNDGWVDAALAASAPGLLDFVALDTDRFIGPSVPFEVAGFEFSIPGNFDIPRQVEFYKFFNVNLEKPGFELFPPAHVPIRLAALHAKLPFEQTIDAFRNKTGLINLINKIQFQNLTYLEPQSYSGKENVKMQLSIPLLKIHPLVPKSLAGWDKAYASILNVEKDGKDLLPMDLKVFPDGRRNPATLKLNGFQNNLQLEGHEELFISAATHFPDQFETPPTSIQVTAQLHETLDPNVPETYVALSQPKALSQNGIEWDSKNVDPQNKKDANLQVHTIVVDNQSALQWVIVMNADRKQFSFENWPAHWPTRDLTSSSWSQSYLATKEALTLDSFNVNDLGQMVTHASYYRNM